jgi:hypothetical protein
MVSRQTRPGRLREGSGGNLMNDIVLPKDKVGVFVGRLALENGGVRLEAQPNSGFTVDRLARNLQLKRVEKYSGHVR